MNSLRDLIQMDFAYLDTFTTRTDTTWGALFCNEEMPHYYSANHAHISQTARDPQMVIDEVVTYFRTKEIIPRFYIYDLENQKEFISKLIANNFKYEELVSPVQLWDQKVVELPGNDRLSVELVTEDNYSEALEIECSIKELGGREVREKAMEIEFQHPRYTHYLLRYDNEACATACLFNRRGMEGWDFSYLDERSEEEQLPWDYETIIRTYLKAKHVLLDMGTGGGEFLLSLGHPYTLTSVTEGYLPNFELCKKKLGCLGITVKFVGDDDKLDYADESFDVVLNRHESFDANEVQRVLKQGGIFITQQIGGANNRGLAEFLINDLPESPYKEHTLENNVEKLRGAGLKIIESNEYFPELKFFDIGALVYFASIIEWEFPGFSVDKCYERLMELEKELQSKRMIVSKEHRFIIVGEKVR